MCIIVAKNKGVDLPSKETLENCFYRNNNGAGIMYVENNKVIIDKGYMDFKSFYKRLQKIEKRIGNLKDHAIVMHFRIGTQGNNDKATTHPFPISNNVEDLKATYFRTDVGMVHNGILSKFNYDRTISDTQLFVKDFVSVLKHLRYNFYMDEKVRNLLKNEIGTNNKICFLDKNENIYYIGDKVEDNGVIYSNSTYKPYTTNNYSYSSYSSCYDYYDWWGYPTKSNKVKKEFKKITKKELTIDDFIKNKIKYEILNVGDYWESGTGGALVEKNETIIIDQDDNLWEVIGKELSLIGTDAIVFDKYFNLKKLEFKGGIL